MADRETRTIIVKAETPLAFRLWADFENFPRFMKYVQAVEKTGPRTSHWVVAGPLGRKVQWTAETTRLEENRRIGWNTKDGQGLTTSGEVSFNPLSNGATEITVTLQYVPPAGKAGEIVAELFADPGKRLEEDLRNFKAYAEAQAREGAPGLPASDTDRTSNLPQAWPDQGAATMEPTTIAGVFRQWDNAVNAIDLLSTAGFRADQISLIVPKKVADEHRNRDRSVAGGGAPAAMATQGGAVVGGLNDMLVGTTPLADAGVGSVLFTGPLYSRSSGAAAGQEVETRDRDVVRSLTDAGIPIDRAEVMAEGIKRGFILVAVESEDRSAEAINLMNQANAADVEALSREWQREGWTGFGRSA